MKKHLLVLTKAVLFLTVLILFFRANPAFSDDAVPCGEYIEYTPGHGISVPDIGLAVEPSTVFVFQGTPDPNRGGGGDFGVSWVFYLDVSKKVGDSGSAYAQIKSGWGDSVEKDLDLFSNVNYNAYDVGGNVKLRKFHYEQYFFEDQVSLSCGKYNARDEFAQNKYSYNDDIQFLNWLFNKFPAIEWPSDYCFTIHGGLYPEAFKFIEAEFNFFEGDADWERIFHQGIFTSQVNIRPVYFTDADPEKWEGNYRFYGWVDTRKHTKLTEYGEGASTRTKEIDYGFGASIDQAINGIYGVFGRIGWRRGDLEPAGGGASLQMAWFLGAQMTGDYWGREEDILSLAVGQDVPSDEYIASGGPGLVEGHFEMYYHCQINDVISISPDFQIIWNPGGYHKGDSDPVFAYGIRTRWCF